ncbi:MAG: hypothetical protein ACPLPT_10620 [Moorellales bacterium]
MAVFKQSPYEKYITRNLHLPWHPHLREVSKPVMVFGHDGSQHSPKFRITWWAITEPFVMEPEPMVHDDFDQFLIFLGGDINNMLDLGGVVELTLQEEGKDPETIVLTTGAVIYIPAGLKHCPLVFKEVRDPAKPILFQDMFFAPEYGRRIISQGAQG